MTPSSGFSTKTRNLSPSEEVKLLEKVNIDVLNCMKEFLYEYGQIFGCRVYDELNTREQESIKNKIMMGLSGPKCEYNPDPVPFQEPATPFETDEARQDAITEHNRNEEKRIAQEKKQKKVDDANFEKAGEILDIVLKERDQGLSTLYMNFVLVLFVKADVKSSVQDIGAVKMFRFSKNGKYDHPSENLFIGSDMRLYKNWAGFIENHKIPHNRLVLAPSGGQFTYRDGSLDLDMFHVTKYIRTFVEPVLTSVGLVGTGLLCASLPPVGVAVGIGASGVGAVTGITRGIIELFDRGSHRTLFRTSSIIPTLDIISNALFAHSAVSALRMTNFLKAEQFLSCILFTESAFRIGAVSRLSLDILSTIIAFGLGQLDLLTMSQRLFSCCIFLYNVGLDLPLDSLQPFLSNLAQAVPHFLTYDNIQPYLQLTENYFMALPTFSMVENLREFTGLFSIVLHNVRNSDRLNFGNLTNTLRRLMNIKWNLICEDLKRCKGWVDDYFTPDEHTSNFTNIQLAIVYNLHETLKKFVKCDDVNNVAVDYHINQLMKEIINVWKRMVTLIYPDQTPNIRNSTMVMRYLLDKIDFLVRHNLDQPPATLPSAAPSTSSAPLTEVLLNRPALLPMRDVYCLIMTELVGGNIYEMIAECNEMIAGETLQPIRHVVTHRYASVSFIQQQSSNETTEEVFEEQGLPTAFIKVDPTTKLGVLIKYTI